MGIAHRSAISIQVDVVILEVGMGGTYDCTNLVRRPTVTGINLVDFDHTQILGNTLDKIAWHKAGICKPGRPAFTVPQSKEATDTIIARAKELHAPLQIVPELGDYDWQEQAIELGIQGEHQHRNASLAIQLCRTWIEEHEANILGRKTDFEIVHTDIVDTLTAPAFKLPDTFKNGLRNCFWPARSQIIKRENVTYYMDGAHTQLSTRSCIKWFEQATEQEKQLLGSRCVRVLMYNVTKGRDAKMLMEDLVCCNFSAAAFCPNITNSEPGHITVGRQLLCEEHYSFTISSQILPI
uniref:tetrahydrofolate synthase n=1 Tax=Saccoglossus kowalevskii TaxID=10224 RepID=A0ABM0MZ55_SACKO|nr:PREDICTED: folylpolyglutamate synthase, mitochondrial-like [Saccoglossus kowalevskii]